MTAKVGNAIEKTPKVQIDSKTKGCQCLKKPSVERSCSGHLVDPHSPSVQAYLAASRAMERMELNSCILDPTKEESLARFQRNEVRVGKVLGRGGFSNVYEVRKFDHPGELRKSIASSCRKQREHEARSFLSDHAVRATTGDARYAIKFLRGKTVTDPKRFRIGAVDLATEAKVLANLDHPHIIKIRGVARDGVFGYSSHTAGRADGYFLIVDRLYDTLRERIQKWAKVERKYKGSVRGLLFDRNGAKRRERMANRLKVAYDIAGALQYLHGKNIVYRDLKPDNIGFDIRGDVKLFDFGTAREICVRDCESAREEDDPHSSLEEEKPTASSTATKSGEGGERTFDLTGRTGTPRYMSPEVARSEPYNLKADVYTFAIVLWEILSLEKAYGNFDRKMHQELVVNGSVRPIIDKRWPVGIQSLLRQCWSDDLSERLSMNCVYKILREEVIRLRGNDDASELEHNHRRSTYVLPSPRR